MTEDQVPRSIHNATQQSSRSRIETFCNISGVTISPATQSSTSKVHNNMVLILLSGEHLRQTVKIFFDADQCDSFIENLKGQKSPADFKENPVVDAFKEVSNLVAGHMKILFENKGVEVNISLPISLRGFDDLFFPVVETTKYESHWLLTYKNQEILFKNSLIINHSKLTQPIEYLDQQGEIEFL